MLIFSITDPEAVRMLDREINRVENLLDDLKALKAGFRRDDTRWADAPLLNNCRLVNRPAPALTGTVTGHPVLTGDDRPIVTSDLIILLVEERLARTWSRWYRLGREEPEPPHGARRLHLPDPAPLPDPFLSNWPNRRKS